MGRSVCFPHPGRGQGCQSVCLTVNISGIILPRNLNLINFNQLSLRWPFLKNNFDNDLLRFLLSALLYGRGWGAKDPSNGQILSHWKGYDLVVCG